MWYNDVSGIGASDMDMNTCPSYNAGFDACDPFASVLEWSSRGPARVLRRRCRSEGVDRSPYEDSPLPRSAEGITRSHRILPNRSEFTFNKALEAHFARLNREAITRVENHGDYITMPPEKAHYFSGSPKAKFHGNNVSNLLLPNARAEERHLPKVEELLEKDQEMMEVSVKQPLKSILNNPIPKTPPGILKKPKIKTNDVKHIYEGRRRQRASSESDNLFCGFHIENTLAAQDSRLPNNTKRAKDNSATGYSYGTALTLSSNKNVKQFSRKDTSPTPIPNELHELSLLRTTAINSDTTENHLSATPISSPKRTASPVKASPPHVKSPGSPAKTPKTHKPKKPRVPTPALRRMSATTPTRLDSPERKNLEREPNKQMEPELVKPQRYEKDKAPKMEKIEKVVRIDLTERAEKAEKKVIKAEKAILESLERVEKAEKWEKWEKALKADKEKQVSPSPWAAVRAHLPDIIDEDEVAAVTTATAGDADQAAHATKEKEKEPAPQPDATNKSSSYKHLQRESSMQLPENVANCLRPSLFPRVPPYIKFVGHDQTHATKMHPAIQKHLKWKVTSITPIVVKKTLINSGFRLVRSECDTSECPQEETVEWVGIWGKHMKSMMFKSIKEGQKMNHFPGTFQIGRKDRLWRNIQKLASRFGNKEFGIMPRSYVLPHDLKLLKREWDKHSEGNDRWIIKPPAAARGSGIKVVSRWTQIPKKRAVVVQKYVSKPLLINGNKFDMRLYVLMTSIHPLRIYMYKDGLARFASVKYSDEVESLNDKYMHLTNYSINRLSKNYTPNEDFAACEGHKWTLKTLFSYLETEKGVNTLYLWETLKDLVIKTIIAGEASISSLTKTNMTSRYNCYELFGIDVLLDEELKPWVLEVNISPSLHSASPLDTHVKGPLVSTVLNIAQFQIPAKTNLDMLVRERPHKLHGLPYDHRLYTVYLSKEERDKHIIYTNLEERDIYLRDILATLTPDDVRHLIQAEDELTQAVDMERVFPTKYTFKYLSFLNGPRYYNRLFDAWETRYSNNRAPGIQLLKDLCDIGYHLEVPAVPLKRAAPQLSALDRCRMMWTRRHRLIRTGIHLSPTYRRRQRPRRHPCISRGSAATPSLLSSLPRPSNRVHSGTPPTLRAIDGVSSNSARMDTTTESQRKCASVTNDSCAPTSRTDLNRNVQCAEMSEPLVQRVA